MIIVQTPLRLSFFGGGTDFQDYFQDYGGAVISTAIDKFVFIIVKERFDNMIYINYSKKEIVSDISQIEHELIREALKLTDVRKGIEITTLADVPAHGSGLGSSSSVTVGMLHAMYTYQGVLGTAENLAEQACTIEIDTLKKPIGKQDQYIAAYGNMRFITFDKNGVKVEALAIDLDIKKRFNENILLFYTGMVSDSSAVLVEQKYNLNNRIEVLSEMKDLVYLGKEALISGNIDEIGPLMDRGWNLKKKLSNKISNNEINDMYESAKAAGATGGKIAGSGGGGFLLLYCPKDKHQSVRSALKNLRELPIRFEKDGSKVIFNYRTIS